MIHKKKWFIGSLVFAGLLLSACAGGSTDNTGESQAADNAANQDTFTYAISGDPSATNPINTSDRWGLTVNNMIYSPLVAIETDGTEKNILAESVEAAEDGLSITVKLKEDVKWSDGEAFTADDVIFTYEQKVKKENGNADQLWIQDEPVA
ncbi:MAG: ABC transporter substrate-binding protein, partial [Enterococcus sp.]|nr:ABC transporter substrate-binding protein [Enterococcus sp.]